MPLIKSDITAAANDAPAINALAVTPADVDLVAFTKQIYVGTTGDLHVKMAGNENITVFASVPAGTIFRMVVSQVRAATTASDIVIMF